MIDANINRLKEGIRVVEDILRYKDNNKELSSKLKSLRHKAQIAEQQELLRYRDSINDVLRPSTKSEQNRFSLEDILTANLKRAQESARVLEELYKLDNITYSENFKTLRYELYNVEKEIMLNR
ncbi:MAG TPA: thiamine-phosphate pyrophosphorylase [Sulfurimonas autotrophica]|nr:thiamine-phosphate pyrophosphorylase [Sulfurimonas autotrophica]